MPDELVVRQSARENKDVLPVQYFNLVESYNIIEPKTYKQAIISEQKLQWEAAMQEEMVHALPNINIIGCKRTYKIKRYENRKVHRFKARLVAQGFNQKYGCDYDEVFAPVMHQPTFRILLSVAVSRQTIVEHKDIKCAFFMAA